MVRNKYVLSIATHESMQVFQEVVRLAFESLAPQRFQEALQGPELEELKVSWYDSVVLPEHCVC
jgi:hypothetical protein